MLSIPAQKTKGRGHSAPGETPRSRTLIFMGKGVALPTHICGCCSCVHLSALPDSASEGPGNLLGFNHGSLHPAV